MDLAGYELGFSSIPRLEYSAKFYASTIGV